MNPRSAEFAKDSQYERLLRETNNEVDGWGERGGEEPRRPIVFVVGTPRSGTTLLYQILASSGQYTYPTNLIARFYRSPAWGVRTQRLLLPLLPDERTKYSSRAGITEGWSGPHEFGYFWEHHLPFGPHHEVRPDNLDPLRRALAAFEREGGSPLLLKSNILSFLLEDLASALPTSRFVQVTRPLLDVADSIYRTRARFFGSPDVWWSIRPGDAPLQAPPAAQIAHQIHRVEAALARTRDRLGNRFKSVEYAHLCERPWETLFSLGLVDKEQADLERIPEHLQPSMTRSSEEIRSQLEAQLNDWPDHSGETDQKPAS